MLMLMIMYEDYRLHHARARALYDRRGRRIQLVQNGVVGAAKQVVNGAVQLIGYRCNGFKTWKASS